MKKVAGVACVLLLSVCSAAAREGEQALSKDAVNGAGFDKVAPSAAVNAQVLKAEVLLDRAQASPGVIDGRNGANFKKAVAAFAETHGLQAKDLTEPVWTALAQDGAPVLVDYTITADDLRGPFIGKVPTDYGEMAKLKTLGYTDPTQMLSARFHMDPRLLTELNPNADFSKDGTTIVVAAVKQTPIEKKIARIEVDKSRDQVRALGDDGKLVVAYPATIGSEETPSPSGSLQVRAIAPHPDYTYDPDKNFKQGKNTTKLRIAPGPNNPVGSTFIALTKPTYGIHGTPDPTKIDKVGSHGCVRLTNWDVEQLAKAVKKGVPVEFVD